MKIAISAESTIDLPQNLLKEYEISTIPFNILINDEMVLDSEGISQKIFDNFDQTQVLPKTSAINEEQYNEYFSNLLKSYDAIVHICISSQLSCAYENAVKSAKKIKNIYVVDSKNLSTGIALLAIYANELKKSSVEPRQIALKVQTKADSVKVSFIIDRLNYLYKGGRCSALTLFGANMLKIKPQIVVENGKMLVGKKYIGNLKTCVSRYCDDVLNKYPNPDKSIVFITRSSPMTDTVEMVKTKLKKHGFDTVYDTMAGGTISSHCGPNCLGILFIDKD